MKTKGLWNKCVSIYASNFSIAKSNHLSKHKDMRNFSHISINNDIQANSAKMLIDRTKEALGEFLKKADYDLSSFGYEGIRIVRFLNGKNDGFNTESIKLRLDEEAKLIMVHNHPCDNYKEFSSFAWELWSFANDEILKRKGV